MPLYAWPILFGAPALLAVVRVATWLARVLGYPRDPRPGYLDLTPTTPRGVRKEHA